MTTTTTSGVSPLPDPARPPAPPGADPFTATGPGERQRAYAQLAAVAPVRRIVLPGGELAWLVTSYDAVRTALADPRLVKGGPPPTGAGMPVDASLAMNSDLLHLDPPDHTRLRRLVSTAFTRRRVEGLAPRIGEIADGLLDSALADGAGGPGGVVDLVDAYAFPLPMTVIGELLGVPGGDVGEFRSWSGTIVSGAVVAPEEWIAAATALLGYVRELLALKRRAPADDLLSALVAVRDGEDRLSEHELTSMVFLLLLAGHETTVNLIANAVLTLLEHPAELAVVRADPSRTAAVVEEVLRFEGPLQVATPRIAAKDLELGGVVVRAGELVVPGLLAAGRDPARFDDPGSFDPGRAREPQHLTFGHGVHHCLGAPLARLEARIALDRLLVRCPTLRLATPAEELTWRPSFLMHGLARLPVVVR